MSQSPAIPDIPAPALLSFVKQVSAEPSWNSQRLAEILKIKPAEASQVARMLEMLGYAEPVPRKKDVWRNTPSGNTVCGAKPPRFTRESVVHALDQLRTRAEQMNSAGGPPFRVTGLVAFGDFLDEGAKVQAADAGVGLTHAVDVPPGAAVEHKREEHILAELKAKSAMLHLHLLEDWMRRRSHLDLLAKAPASKRSASRRR